MVTSSGAQPSLSPDTSVGDDEDDVFLDALRYVCDIINKEIINSYYITLRNFQYKCGSSQLYLVPTRTKYDIIMTSLLLFHFHIIVTSRQRVPRRT